MNQNDRKDLGHVGAGFVRVEKIDREEVSEGGIVLPEGGQQKKGGFDRLFYAKVVSCGIYCDKPGRPYPELKEYPLPPGTIVEHHRMQPWEASSDKRDVILTSDITNYWLPGEELPRFLRTKCDVGVSNVLAKRKKQPALT